MDHGGADVATRAPAAPTSGTSAIVRAIPLRQAKLVHFVRHCEATSNEAAASRGREAYKDPQFLDAELSAKGIEQAKALRDAILRDKPPVDVVIVSPLNRALSTASIAFEGLAPFVAVEEVRERIGVNPCDRRRSIDEVRADCAVAATALLAMWHADTLRERLPVPRSEKHTVMSISAASTTTTRCGKKTAARRARS